MAPIYESDIASERWSKSEWNNYELWEKVEVRLRRRRRLWIGGTVVAFLLLSAVPIVRERLPAWRSQAAVRRLAQEIGRLKRTAAIEGHPRRITIGTGEEALSFRAEGVTECSDPRAPRLPDSELRTGALLGGMDHALMDPSSGIPGLVRSFCYDAHAGSETTLQGKEAVGFGVGPVSDLADGRQDRSAILLLSGPSAEISFE